MIDLGPGGGVNGGKVISEGPPEKIGAVAVSATGQYLRADPGAGDGETEGGGRRAQECEADA